MDAIKPDIGHVYNFTGKEEIFSLKSKVEKANKALHERTGKGSDYLGWVSLPSSVNDGFLSDIEQLAARLKSQVDIVVVIGIGGSYLGAKAIVEALSDSFSHLKNKDDNPLILFAGHNIGEDYLSELMELLDHNQEQQQNQPLHFVF
jgi:glucose-6-phosphate isomerase